MSNQSFLPNVISFFALLVAILTLYLQRRDRKPRLRVEFERAYFPLPSGTTVKGAIASPTPSFTIRLRNQTEKTINVEKTCFIDGKKRTFVLPNNWKTVSQIPSYDHRAFNVSVIEFEKWAKEVRMFRPEKGRFVIVDGPGKRHKSTKLGDLLSMQPAKLP